MLLGPSLVLFGGSVGWSTPSLRQPSGRALHAARCASPVLAADWALLFDCDGVLADTERDGHRVGFNQAFGENDMGYEWGVDEYGRLCEVGGGKERMTAYMNANDKWPEAHKSPTTEALEKGLPVDEGRLELVKGLHKRKTVIFQELIGAGTVPLRPGILRIVDEAIAADVPLAVCSTSNEAAVRTLVQTLMGEERYAKFTFFCGDVVPRKKPNPDVSSLVETRRQGLRTAPRSPARRTGPRGAARLGPLRSREFRALQVYNLASETMGFAAARCVVVEDSGIGLKAAKAADMSCCVTTSTYTAGEFGPELGVTADLLVPELGEPGSETCVTLADLQKLLG